MHRRQSVGTTQNCTPFRRFESRKWGNKVAGSAKNSRFPRMKNDWYSTKQNPSSFAWYFHSPDSNTPRTAFSGQEVSTYILYRSLCPSLGRESVARLRRYRTGHPRAIPPGLFTPPQISPHCMRYWRVLVPLFG